MSCSSEPLHRLLLWSPLCQPMRHRVLGPHSPAVPDCSKIQVHSQQSAGLHRFTWGYQSPEKEDESRWERGKGSACVFIFYQAQLFGGRERKKRRLVLWAGALPSFLPPWLVQALHRLCRLYNSNFWKHTPESGPVQRQRIPALCMVGFYFPP